MSEDGVELAPSAIFKGPPVLSPSYYTSSLFVLAARADIAKLLVDFEARYAHQSPEPTSPLALFKTLWRENSWDFLHFRCIDARSRVEFLKTIFRLFIESTESCGSATGKAGALFGLSIFYWTQPCNVPSPPASMKRIPIAVDTYANLLNLPGTLKPPLKQYAQGVLFKLVDSNSFFILPRSTLSPYNPRSLPHSTIATLAYVKKTGRPTKTQIAGRAKVVMDKVEKWVEAMERVPAVDTPRGSISSLDPATQDISEDTLMAAPSAPFGFTPVPTAQTVSFAEPTAEPSSRPARPPRATRAQKQKQLALDVDTENLKNPLHAPPPDLSEYVRLKDELRQIVPVEIQAEAERATRENIANLARIMAEQGVSPDNPEGEWAGRKRMEEVTSLLDLLTLEQGKRPRPS